MNNTFDFTRFSMLFAKHTKEHLSIYLMSLGVLAAILCIFLGFAAYTDNGYVGPHVQADIYIIFMIFSGAIFTTLVFSDYGDKKKAIPLLTLPVSHLEKYLVGWLYSYIVFLLLYAGCFYFIDSIVLNIGDLTAAEKNRLVNVITIEDAKFPFALLGYTFLHSVCLSGAIFFEKLHTIKTGFTFFAALLGVVLFNQPLLQLIFGGKALFSSPFGAVRITEGEISQSLEPTEMGGTILIVLLILLTLILWTSAYYKLKEKEV